MRTFIEQSQNKIVFCALLPLLLTPLLSTEFPRVLAYLPLLSVFFAMPFLKDNWRQHFQLFKPFGLFCLFCILFLAVHTVLVATQEASFERLYKLISIIIGGSIFLFSLYQLPVQKISCYLRMLIISCAAASIIVISELVDNEIIYRSLRGLTNETISTAVFNRGVLTITLLSLMAFFLIEKKNQPFIYLSAIPILGMLFLTQSQSAQLAFMFALGFYFIFPSSLKIAWGALWFCISGLMLIKPFLVTHVFNMLPGFVDNMHFFKHSYVGPRFEIWDYISKKIYESPIVGHGIEFTKTYDQFANSNKYTEVTSVLHPHSFVMQLWIEFGVLGVLVCITAITFLMRYLYMNLEGNMRRSAISVVATVILIGSFSYGMWQSWWLGLLFMIAGWFIVVSKRDENSHRA